MQTMQLFKSSLDFCSLVKVEDSRLLRATDSSVDDIPASTSTKVVFVLFHADRCLAACVSTDGRINYWTLNGVRKYQMRKQSVVVCRWCSFSYQLIIKGTACRKMDFKGSKWVLQYGGVFSGRHVRRAPILVRRNFRELQLQLSCSREKLDLRPDCDLQVRLHWGKNVVNFKIMKSTAAWIVQFNGSHSWGLGQSDGGGGGGSQDEEDVGFDSKQQKKKKKTDEMNFWKFCCV